MRNDLLRQLLGPYNADEVDPNDVVEKLLSRQHNNCLQLLSRYTDISTSGFSKCLLSPQLYHSVNNNYWTTCSHFPLNLKHASFSQCL